MYIIAKKSGSGRAVELFGHTEYAHLAESWNYGAPDNLVFEIDDTETSNFPLLPLEPMDKP